MSYTNTHRSLGDTTSWSTPWANTGDVYVWRAGVAGASIATPDDLAAVVRAAGMAKGGAVTPAPNHGLDIRGAAVTPGGKDVDVVMTAASWTPYVVDLTAQKLADAILADPSLRQRFPSLAFNDPKWLQLVGPPGAVDFWRSRSVLWDHNAGPTQAFTALQNLFTGTADDGTSLHNLAPTPVPEPTPVPGAEPSGAGGASPVLWIFGTIAVTWLAARKLWRS